jgi:hypothetical protein
MCGPQKKMQHQTGGLRRSAERKANTLTKKIEILPINPYAVTSIPLPAFSAGSPPADPSALGGTGSDFGGDPPAIVAFDIGAEHAGEMW